MRIVLSLAALLTCSTALAQASSELNCTIVGASEVRPDGQLQALAGGKNYYETTTGAEFIVQRDKGLMMGRFVSNAGRQITVLDPGSVNRSYKVLSVSPRAGARVQTQYFEVRLQDKGERKSFVLVAADVLYGHCPP